MASNREHCWPDRTDSGRHGQPQPSEHTGKERGAPHVTDEKRLQVAEREVGEQMKMRPAQAGGALGDDRGCLLGGKQRSRPEDPQLAPVSSSRSPEHPNHKPSLETKAHGTRLPRVPLSILQWKPVSCTGALGCDGAGASQCSNHQPLERGPAHQRGIGPQGGLVPPMGVHGKEAGNLTCEALAVLPVHG